MITAVAALVLVLVVAAVLVLTSGGADETTTASVAPGSARSTAPSSAPSRPRSPAEPFVSGGLSSAPSGAFSSAPPAGGAADPADFLAQLPIDLTDCTERELAGDGDIAAARCGPAVTQPGPAEATFYLYPDVATLDDVFRADVTEEALVEFTGADDCWTTTGFGPWTYADGTPGGQVACQVTDDGNVLVAWTDDQFLTEGVLRAPGTTQDDVSALYEWWTSDKSEYQG